MYYLQSRYYDPEIGRFINADGELSEVGGDIRGEGLGFQPLGRDGKTKEQLGQHFAPEFLGRLDKIVCFSALQEQTMEGIAKKYLVQLQQRAEMNGMQLHLPDDLASELSRAVSRKGDARQLRSLVQERVEGPLAMFLLKHGKKPAQIRSKLENGELYFTA